MRLGEFDYHLPTELIAQDPAEPRDSARLFVYDRATETVTHAHVRDLPRFLLPRTTLVANNSRVRHSRLHANLDGKYVEILVVEPAGEDRLYRCLLRGKGMKDGSRFAFAADDAWAAELIRREDVPGMTTFILEFQGPGSPDAFIESCGELPLPPYITQSTAEEGRYQTVFAKDIGSAAAPTAGLHFTPELIAKLEADGHRWDEVTLHVGLGTFLPLRNDVIEENKLHSELTHISERTAADASSTVREGGTLLAIGTTSMRTLESHSGPEGLAPGWKSTDMFIYPGYRFQSANALLTNFHLPKSSLLLLVAAFLGNTAGRNAPLGDPERMAKTLMDLYAQAVKERYRFFSFGDAMLIL